MKAHRLKKEKKKMQLQIQTMEDEQNPLLRNIFRIFEESPLINKSIQQIEQEYHIKVLRKFNPKPIPAKAKKPKPKELIYEFICLDVEGSCEAMKKFSSLTGNRR